MLRYGTRPCNGTFVLKGTENTGFINTQQFDGIFARVAEIANSSSADCADFLAEWRRFGHRFSVFARIGSAGIDAGFEISTHGLSAAEN
jgi:hypothetical protein